MGNSHGDKDTEADEISDIIGNNVEHQLKLNGHDEQAVNDVMEIIDWKYYNLIYETIEYVENKEM